MLTTSDYEEAGMLVLEIHDSKATTSKTIETKLVKCVCENLLVKSANYEFVSLSRIYCTYVMPLE